MRSWVDLERDAKNIGNQYAFYYKPFPAIFTEDHWDADAVKTQLKKDLAKTKDCWAGIIMEDTRTVKQQLERLWDWAKIAIEVV